MPGWHGFSLVNTLVLHPECTQHNLHWSEGLLPPTNGEKRGSTSVLYICISLVEITIHHLTRWKANILSQAWETHPINEAFFHPLVSLTRVTAHHKEQLAQNTICQLGGRRGRFIHDLLSSVSIYSVFLVVERRPSAILGHRNVRYSAICSSNCRVREIFYISCIEAQQLQLAWHAVGVFKGGVVAKRVSKTNHPLRTIHPRAPTYKHTQMHTVLHVQMPTCPQSHNVLLSPCTD